MMLKTKQYSPDREEQQQATAQSDQSAEVPYKPQYNYTGRIQNVPINFALYFDSEKVQSFWKYVIKR